MRNLLAVLVALSCPRRLASSSAPDATALLQAALQLHQAGRVGDAAKLYARVSAALGAATPASVHSNHGKQVSKI